MGYTDLSCLFAVWGRGWCNLFLYFLIFVFLYLCIYLFIYFFFPFSFRFFISFLRLFIRFSCDIYDAFCAASLSSVTLFPEFQSAVSTVSLQNTSL